MKIFRCFLYLTWNRSVRLLDGFSKVLAHKAFVVLFLFEPIQDMTQFWYFFRCLKYTSHYSKVTANVLTENSHLTVLSCIVKLSQSPSSLLPNTIDLNFPELEGIWLEFLTQYNRPELSWIGMYLVRISYPKQ